MIDLERVFTGCPVGSYQRVVHIRSHQFMAFKGLTGRVMDVRLASWIEEGVAVRMRFEDGREAFFGPEQLEPIDIIHNKEEKP